VKPADHTRAAAGISLDQTTPTAVCEEEGKTAASGMGRAGCLRSWRTADVSSRDRETHAHNDAFCYPTSADNFDLSLWTNSTDIG
jgi:hypothetical protein